MIKYSFLITLTLFLIACGGETEAPYPEDLAGKKALLAQKQATLETLEADIEKLQNEINELAPPKEKPRSLVTTTKVSRKDFHRFVEIQGAVQSDDYVNATSEVAGRIIQFNLQEGQFIRKGDLVAKLDMEQVNKQIAELEKSLELAVDVHARQKRLWDQNIGSEMQYLQAKNNKERLEKSLETASFQLTKANVYAPISGIVEMVNLKSGELASPGMPIIQILNTNQVKVVADVPESYLQAVKRGEMVKVKFPALDMEKEARVSRIGTTINPNNRTFEVEINLPNSQGIFKPNLLANMMINDLSKEDVVTLPLDLVQQEVSGKDYVLIATAGENGLQSKKVYVTTAESYDGEIVIEEGLTGEETLILDGARSLGDEVLIQIAEK